MSTLLTADFKKGFNFGFLCKKMLDGKTTGNGFTGDILPESGGLYQVVTNGFTNVQEIIIPVTIVYDMYRDCIPLESYTSLIMQYITMAGGTASYTTITASNGNFTGVLGNFKNGYTYFHTFGTIQDAEGNKFARMSYTGSKLIYGTDFSNVGIGTGSGMTAAGYKNSNNEYEYRFYLCSFGSAGNAFLRKTSTIGDGNLFMGLITRDEFISYNTSGYENEMTGLIYRSNENDVTVTNTSNCYGNCVPADATHFQYLINAVTPHSSLPTSNQLGLSTMGLNIADPDDTRFARLYLGHANYPKIFGLKDMHTGKAIYVIKVPNTVQNTESSNIVFPISDVV